VLGSARIVAERVRLNVRLVQAGDGAPLWSQDYDAERGKIFDLEEEIAEKIAAALKVSASPGALVRSRTGDFDAYLDFMLDHRPAYANLAARYIGWDGNEDLSRLFARDVFHSGVLERSDIFARALVEKLRRPVSFPHDNRTGRNRVPHFTSAQRRKTEQLYPLDFALYEWQLARLEEGISARYGASVDAAA